jgi:DNA-binding NarL/FixJ family response regulator
VKPEPAEVVGRDPELERLGASVEAGFSPRALVLSGNPGIGQTTLWEAGIALARGRGKEIAATLFVTVQTVEAHLSHTYAKLGVRSRPPRCV